MLEQHSLKQPTSWYAVAVYTLVFFLCFCQSWQTIIADSKEIQCHTWKEVFQVLGFNLTLTKLPVIIIFHGGGFVLYSASSEGFHYYVSNMTARVRAVVASVEYRLAPENPLPAAYEDAFHAILWLRSQAQARCCYRHDPWLHQHADFSKVFILGESAGGNIAYHAALRATSFNLYPMRIQGVVLDQAFFGGVERTSSELRLIEDPFLPLYMNDAYWSLALPFQANRDHEFSNPFIHGFHRVKRVPRWFVKDDEGDPLVDRAKEFVRLLELYKVPVSYRFNSGGFHGIELVDLEAAIAFFHDVKNFIYHTERAAED